MLDKFVCTTCKNHRDQALARFESHNAANIININRYLQKRHFNGEYHSLGALMQSINMPKCQSKFIFDPVGQHTTVRRRDGDTVTMVISIEREQHQDPDFYVGTHFIPDDFILDGDFYELLGVVFYRNQHYCAMIVNENNAVIMDSNRETPFIVEDKNAFWTSTMHDLDSNNHITYKMAEIVEYTYVYRVRQNGST